MNSGPNLTGQLTMKPIASTLVFITAVLMSLTVRGTLVEYQNSVRNEATLISYYTFDSGNANDTKSTFNGTPEGTVDFGTGVGGGSDKSVVLAGAGHINLGMIDAFDFASGAGTIEAWIRADWIGSPGYNPAIFADRDSGVNWSIHMNSGKDGVGLWNGSSYQALAVSGGGAGTNWHHFAVVFQLDGTTGEATFAAYWDGSLLSTTTQGLGSAPESPTQLGSSSVAGAERWPGTLDEVAFYSSALSSNAIKAHYTAFLVGEKPSIIVPPVGGTYLAGIALSLSVEAKGAQLSYQWFKDGTAIAGATSPHYDIAQLAAANVGAYSVTISNVAGVATSAPVEVTLGTSSAKVERYQAAVRAESSLVSYYTFDSVSGQDAKGSNHGTVQGQVQFGPGIGGLADKALVMNGSGHLNLGQVTAFDFASGQGTVEAWVRADWTTGLGYNPAIFADRNGGPVNWSFHMNDSKDGIGLWNGSTHEPRTAPGIGVAWHHVATVYSTDPGTGEPSFTMYWDGQAIGATAQALGTAPESPTQLGSASPGGQERWVGAMDEVAFYSAALTADDINKHYSEFITGTPPVITVQPAGGTYFVGDPITLAVGVQGVDLSYQWLKNGTAIVGETNASLTLSALTSADTATYRVKVTNPDGTIESADASVTAAVPNLAKYQAAVRAEGGLVSYYTFDNGDAKDSKSSHHGAAVDTIAFGTGVGGGTDQTLLLSGIGHVELGQVDAFDFSSGKGTVEAWVRADWTSGPGYNPALFSDRDGTPVNWSIHMNSGKEAGGLWNGSSYTALPLARTGVAWHHVAAVFDRTDGGASSFRLYWDGALAGATQQGLGNAPESPTELGSSYSLGAEYWIGGLDEVAFYNTALTASDVQRHFQALLASVVSQAPSLATSRAGNQLTLSWPADATGFVLEFSAQLGSGTWTPVSNVIGNSASVNVATGYGFYRLRKP